MCGKLSKRGINWFYAPFNWFTMHNIEYIITNATSIKYFPTVISVSVSIEDYDTNFEPLPDYNEYSIRY